MAAGRCEAAYNTDEGNGYGCHITGGACMFLYPDSRACAEQYGEGPGTIRKEIPTEWFRWRQAEKVEKLYCPMLERVVFVYRRDGSRTLYTAPFRTESGDMFYYEFDSENEFWHESAVQLIDWSAICSPPGLSEQRGGKA